MEIDNTDYAILKAIHDQDRPLWKNKIHQYIADNERRFPLSQGVSVQTVGRRVDDLNNEEYLENAIISPDELQRDLIIAFKLQDKGREVLEQKRKELLQDVVQGEMFGADAAAEIGKGALIELISDEFDIEKATREQLETDYSRDQIVAFLTLYYTEKQAVNVFDSEYWSKLEDLFSDDTELTETFEETGLRRDPAQ